MPVERRWLATRWRGRVSVLLAASLLAAAALGAPVRATRELVVTANPHATRAGLEILRAGGNAVDAAIAAQLVLGLVEPQSSGVGGGAFMLYAEAGESLDDPVDITAYEGRETAPAAATPDMFLRPDGEPMSFFEAGTGGLAVGVPGVLRMLDDAHRAHGRLAWSELVKPAERLAEQGFELSPRLHFLLDQIKPYARVPEFLATYYDAEGKPLPVGTRLVNRSYAATLALLAQKGVEPLYSGKLAEDIVAAVHENPVRAGRLELEDLKAYRAHSSAPLCSAYREWRLCGPQLPSSGGITVQQALGMLQRFDLGASGVETPASIHLIAEASRLAFADRNLYLGDPAFVNVPVAALLAPDYIAARAALIDPQHALENVPPGVPLPRAAARLAPSPAAEQPSTSHFSIVDRWGNALSMTTSVQGAFGSQLMVGGFILNDELTDFSFRPTIDGRQVANRIGPSKHPLSSMAPTIVLDAAGRVRLLIGSPGGSRIINFVAQAVIETLDWHRDIDAAVAAPHFVAQTDRLELEQGTRLLDETAALEALGHHVVARSLNSGLHGIVIEYTPEGRVLWGGVDPRREGLALGD